MSQYIEELILEGSPPKWYAIQSPSDLAPIDGPTDSTADSDRNALPDNGFYEQVPNVNCGLMPSTVAAGGGSTLPLWTGSYTFAANNATQVVITGYRFDKGIYVTGRNYKFKNCYFASIATALVAGAVVQAQHENCRTNVFEDCEVRIIPTGTKTGLGVMGHNLTLRRVYVHDTEDGVNPYRAAGGDMAFRVYGSYISDLLFYSPDSAVGGSQSDHQTHTDAMQFRGGTNIRIENSYVVGKHNMALGDASEPPLPVDSSGNAITGSGHVSGNTSYPSDTSISACMFNSIPAGTGFGDIVFSRNRLGGGAVTFNALTFTPIDGKYISITDNIWVKASKYNIRILTNAARAPYLIVTGNRIGSASGALDNTVTVQG